MVCIYVFLFLFSCYVVWLCDPMDHSTPGFPVLHYLPEFAQTHVHWVSDVIQPSHSLSPSSPPDLSLSHIRVFSNELPLCIRWPKYWNFSFSISPCNEYLRLISFWIDWIWSLCSSRDSQESFPAPQFESISSLALSFPYGPTFTSVHEYWKNYSFDYMDLCQQSDFSVF